MAVIPKSVKDKSPIHALLVLTLQLSTLLKDNALAIKSTVEIPDHHSALGSTSLYVPTTLRRVNKACQGLQLEIDAQLVVILMLSTMLLVDVLRAKVARLYKLSLEVCQYILS